jgi:hypothetical protein
MKESETLGAEFILTTILIVAAGIDENYIPGNF